MFSNWCEFLLDAEKDATQSDYPGKENIFMLEELCS